MLRNSKTQAFQLNSHCKRLFLEQYFKNIEKNKNDNKNRVFLKLLTISKSYLNACRQTCKLQVSGDRWNNEKEYKIVIMPATKFEDGYPDPMFKLSYEELCKLIDSGLLNLRHVGMYTYSGFRGNDEKLLDKLGGKICLYASSKYSDSKELKQFAYRLYQVGADIYNLIDPENFSLNVDYCRVWFNRFEKKKFFDQLKKLLSKHKMKELDLKTTKDDSPWSAKEIDLTFLTSSYFNDFPHCPKIQKLTLKIGVKSKNGNFMSFLSQLVNFMPNLKEIDIKVYFQNRTTVYRSQNESDEEEESENEENEQENEDTEELGRLILKQMQEVKLFSEEKCEKMHKIDIYFHFTCVSNRYSDAFQFAYEQIKTQIDIPTLKSFLHMCDLKGNEREDELWDLFYKNNCPADSHQHYAEWQTFEDIELKIGKVNFSLGVWATTTDDQEDIMFQPLD